MKLKIEQWPISRLKKFDRNARLHSDAQVAQLAASIKEFGFVNPVLVDGDDVLIAGHGRISGAEALGLETVPVIRLGHLSEDQARALRIADNRLPLSATWDADLLRIELNELSLAGYEMPLLGFDPPELVDFMTESPRAEADPEKTPELPARAVSRLGDLWVLGKHRLLCGDSTKAEDVERLMQGHLLDLVFSDPPYNVAYSGLGQNNLGTIKNDNQDDTAFAAWIDLALASFARSMKANASIYICHPDSASAPKLAFEHAFAKHFHKSATLIWAKQSAGMGWQDYRVQHEPILYGWKQGKKGAHFFTEQRDKTSLWPLSRDAQLRYVHPTQKPVSLPAEAIRNSSKAGWKVGDFFCGSGSTLIACESEKRSCFAMEMDPRFVDVIARRWEEFSGATAVLDGGDGSAFQEVARARQETRRPRSRKGGRAPGSRRSNPERV